MEHSLLSSFSDWGNGSVFGAMSERLCCEGRQQVSSNLAERADAVEHFEEKGER